MKPAPIRNLFWTAPTMNYGPSPCRCPPTPAPPAAKATDRSSTPCSQQSTSSTATSYSTSSRGLQLPRKSGKANLLRQTPRYLTTSRPRLKSIKPMTYPRQQGAPGRPRHSCEPPARRTPFTSNEVNRQAASPETSRAPLRPRLEVRNRVPTHLAAVQLQRAQRAGQLDVDIRGSPSPRAIRAPVCYQVWPPSRMSISLTATRRSRVTM
jgi:hypothetical protein